jgi:RNA polymerase sigma-70 factor (ECF subfamily)
MSAEELTSEERALFELARGTWPGIELDGSAFAAYVRERAAPTLHAADLYLACACARGDKTALAAFDRDHLARVGDFVKRVDPSAAFADEVRQVLRHKLFVRDGESRAKIADYTGRGPLGGWLRIAAIRVARDLQRGQGRRAHHERGSDGDVRPPSPDPELQLVKGRYAGEFRTAFQTTLESLSAKERSVLSLYFLEGMTTSAIGALYRVEGATVRHWIKQMRAKILEETRRLLSARLELTGDLDSILKLVESQLDLSISRLLRR